jgi:hypothetical protein
MDHSDGMSIVSSEEQVARIVWSAHILSYLAKKCNLSESEPTAEENALAVEQDGDNDSVVEHENDGDDDDDDDDDSIHSVTDSERTALLSDPQDNIAKRLLNCIAQLLSPRHRWAYVTATAMKEHEDFVEIFVARNDCFAEHGKAAQDLCNALQRHMSTSQKGERIDCSSPDRG